VARPIVSRRAQKDLRRIWRWIANDAGVRRADELVDRILAVCGVFAMQPQAGRLHPDFGPAVRSCMSGPYLIFYRPRGAAIEIIRVIDGRRDVPAAWAEPDPSNGAP
jgi:plasmid stabilization system protein ParE